VLAETLQRLRGLRLKDEDGEEVTIELLPPATPEEIRVLEASVPAPLPADIREALAVSKGILNGPLESFSLLDLAGFGLEELFPYPHSIAHDGFGNYWIIDLLPTSVSWGPVLFACHDPAVIVYQAATIDQFLVDTMAMWQPGPQSPVDFVHDQASLRIYREHPDLIAQSVALLSNDPVVAAFAARLPPSASLVDLRDPAIGDGFEWCRFGPKTLLWRCETDRLWAYAPPEKQPSFLGKLFGR
jgi:cell wall assembly regulator SMI1